MPPVLFTASVAATIFFGGFVLRDLKLSSWWPRIGCGLSLLAAIYTFPRSQPLPIAENRLTTPQTTPAATLPKARIHLDTNAGEIMNLYKSKTTYQADAVVSGYKGKWMNIDGEIANIKSSDTQMRVFVYFDKKKQNHSLGSLASLDFIRSKFESAISTMRGGDNIAATCEFNSADRSGLDLINCELTPPTPQSR
jgi:hypothetical protein